MTINHKNAFVKILFFFTFLFPSMMLMGQGVYSIVELTDQYSSSYEPTILGGFDGRVLFTDVIDGQQKLWISDGTEDGTFQLGGVEQIEVQVIGKTDEAWYFREERGEAYHLSILTAGSDELVSLYNNEENIRRACYWNENIYFSIKSSSSSAADDLVKFSPVTLETEILFTSDFGGIGGMVPMEAGVMFMTRMDEGEMLGMTDGTLANTTTYYTLDTPTTALGFIGFMRSDGDRVFFMYRPNDEDYSLWVSDGTAEATMLLKSQAYESTYTSLPDGNYAFLDGKFYFAMRDAGSPSGTTFELNVSDGTVNGTFGLNPNPMDDYLHPRRIRPFNDKIYFNGSLGINHSLMVTEGTPESTEVVIPSNAFSAGYGSLYESGVYNDSLMLQAKGDDIGIELYISDGTVAGSRLLADIAPGEEDSYPKQFTQVGDLLYFFTDINFVRSLWVYDPDFVPCANINLDTIAVTDATSTTSGAMEIFVSGGTAPYLYQISPFTEGYTSLFENLTAGTYNISITDANGCTLAAEVTINLASSVLEPDVVEEFQVFPNPAVSEYLNVRMGLNEGLEAIAIEIHDLSGRSILREANIPVHGTEWLYQIDISNVISGQYLLLITSENKVLATSKFTVQHTN